MSNENSNLRVGSAGAGLFVGSTEILGGGVDNIFKLHESLTSNEFQAFIIANASSLPINLFVSYSMADDYEIEDNKKALDDVINNYQKEKLMARRNEIIQSLNNANLDKEKASELEKELHTLIIKLAQIK